MSWAHASFRDPLARMCALIADDLAASAKASTVPATEYNYIFEDNTVAVANPWRSLAATCRLWREIASRVLGVYRWCRPIHIEPVITNGITFVQTCDVIAFAGNSILDGNLEVAKLIRHKTEPSMVLVLSINLGDALSVYNLSVTIESAHRINPVQYHIDGPLVGRKMWPQLYCEDPNELKKYIGRIFDAPKFKAILDLCDDDPHNKDNILIVKKTAKNKEKERAMVDLHSYCREQARFCDST
jgi:hypothetical protein